VKSRVRKPAELTRQRALIRKLIELNGWAPMREGPQRDTPGLRSHRELAPVIPFPPTGR
jgi:hypothetical protein